MSTTVTGVRQSIFLMTFLATLLLNFIMTGSLLGLPFLAFLCLLKIVFHMNLIIFLWISLIVLSSLIFYAVLPSGGK